MLSNALLLLIFTVPSTAQESDRIMTTYGPVKGTNSRHESVEAFKGIPYAAPPVGNLRWRPPQPPKKWTETRECNRFSPTAMQKNDRRQNEDCLYLNVWRLRKEAPKKRPVMVWIHGGGFTQGSGHEPGYEGTQLAKRGVVVVTLNYRLGAFGFFAHPALSAESPTGSSGNYGILDQIAALKWVRDNISQFGGDPENVTIFGESAGGTSVYLLTATPLSKGLFHRAILQSPWLDPAIFRNLKTENENGASTEDLGQQQARLLLAGAGSNEEDKHAQTSNLKKMRAISAKKIVNEMQTLWPVTIDGWVIPKAPYLVYRAGEQHDIPVIIGTNRDEGTMFAPRSAFGGTLDGYRAEMEKRFGESGPRVAEFYQPQSEKDLWKTAVQQISDSWFIQPAREFARAMDRQDTRVWMYHFTKPVWGWMGAAHAAEIGYVFGNLPAPKPEDSKLSDAFMSYWVQFATEGNPNMDGQVEWPTFKTNDDQHLIMDNEIKAGTGLRNKACNMLDEILDERRSPAQSRK